MDGPMAPDPAEKPAPVKSVFHLCNVYVNIQWLAASLGVASGPVKQSDANRHNRPGCRLTAQLRLGSGGLVGRSAAGCA